jgi:hypothetical protein
VLGEFAGEDEADRGLDLARRDGGFLVDLARCTASCASFSKMSLMKEFMIDMALEEMPMSGCTCFSTLKM